MKTFFVVTFYTVMVAALDLGGAVWTSLHTARPTKAAAVMIVTDAPAKTVNAVRTPAAIPSDT